MKTPSRSTLTSKRVVVPAGLLAGVLVVGGGALAFGALDGDDSLTGDDLDRATSAALAEVGDGNVTSAEISDDTDHAYELEVRLPDGSEVDVELDEDYQVVRTDRDDDGSPDGDDGDDRDDDAYDTPDSPDSSPDADDRRLTDAEYASIERAALAETGGGTLTDAEASDDRGVAYDAEVRLANGDEVDLDLDADFGIISTQTERDDD